MHNRLHRFASSEFIRHGFLVFAATNLVNALGYAYHFAISRRIGVEQYGVLAALNAAVMLSLAVSTIVATVVVKYAAEFRAVDDTARLAALVRKLLVYGSAVSVAACVAGVVCAAPIGAYLRIDNLDAVALAMIVIGITILTPSLRAVFQGIEDFRTFSVSWVLEALLKATLGIGFVYLGWGVRGAFAGWAIGSLCALGYTAAVLFARYWQHARVALYVDTRRLVTTMANVSAATLLITLLSYVDVLVFKHFADPTTAGLYGALSLSGKMLLFLVAFVPAVVLPKASRLAVTGGSPVGVLLQALLLVAVLSAGGLVFYDLFPRLVVTALAGASFAPAAPFVFSYGCAMVLLAALTVIVTYKMGIHRFDFVWPLAVCTIGEIVGICVHHASISDVVTVLVVGNSLALVAVSYRVNAPVRAPAVVQRSDAAA